jgi:uncharacterized protein (TIGR00369 family)
MVHSRVRPWTTWDVVSTVPPMTEGLEFIRALIAGTAEPPPAARDLGLELLEADEGRVVFAYTPQDRHIGLGGVLAGGVTAAVLDATMGIAAFTTLEPIAPFGTLELKVNFVRPITAGAGRLTCEGRVLHAGRSVITAEGRLRDAEGTLYAHGTTSCAVRR